MEETFKKLEYAKDAVRSCLVNANVLVDMHGLEYWAKEVERLRNIIRSEV